MEDKPQPKPEVDRKHTTCKELFKIFNGIGKELECRYDTKKCTMISTLLNTKMVCDLQPFDGMLIDRELWVYAPRHNELVQHIPNTNNITVDRLHRYQEADDIGIKLLSYVEH